MIVTGLFSGLSEDPTHRFAWFLVSTGAFLALYAALFGPLRREALGGTRSAAGRTSATPPCSAGCGGSTRSSSRSARTAPA